MPASAHDSAIFRDLLQDAEVARLFTDSAELRAMLLVEGALAEAQGALGLIPPESAAFLARACQEVQIDPAALAVATGVNAVPVPALVEAFRKAVDAPAHTPFFHWGATSQDIVDSGLMLRLRQVLAIYEARLDALIGALARLARDHAALPMAARTYMQAATPTSFGAVVAGWGWPLLRHRDRLAALKPRLLQLSLSGAAGTLGAMGPKGPEVRAAMAAALRLGDPGRSWHSSRDSIAEFAGWMTGLAASLGKMAEDLMLLSQSGIAEVSGGAGASSTMPQKANPVGASVIAALARQMIGLNANMQGAAIHRQQRDAAAWITEWLSLPQMCIGLGRALALSGQEAAALRPDAEAMARAFDDGLIHAEALSFALTDRMPRPEAQAAIKALAAEVRATGRPLAELAAARWPDRDWPALLAPAAQLGEAPAEARAFAKAAGSQKV